MAEPQVINATPHPLRIYLEGGEAPALVLPPSHIIFRAGERLVDLDDRVVVDGISIPMHGAAYGEPTAFDHEGRPIPVPQEQPGVFYVVALPVALGAVGRRDLLVCGPAVRDANGRPAGCIGLTIPHHPAAARL